MATAWRGAARKLAAMTKGFKVKHAGEMKSGPHRRDAETDRPVAFQPTGAVVDRGPDAAAQRLMAQAIDQSSRVAAQREQVTSIEHSPRVAAQRQATSFLQSTAFEPPEAIQLKIESTHNFPKRGALSIDMNPTLDADTGQFGEAGSIRFSPVRGAKEGEFEPANKLALVQVVRTEVPNGEDYPWRGPQQPREFLKTPPGADDGIEGGWMVDHDASRLGQRQQPTDAPVRRDYNATIPDANGEERFGSSLGFFAEDVVLFDHPASNAPMRWRFETAVIASRDAAPDINWGAVQWSFATEAKAGSERKPKREYSDWEIRDPACAFVDAPSATFAKAQDMFDDYYRNPEAQTAPERLEAALLARAQALRDTGKFSPAYLSAHLRVHEYARALRRLVEIPAPAYENQQHHQSFEALRAVFQQLITLAFQRSNIQFNQPSEGLMPVPVPVPVVGMPDADDLEEKVQAETDDERIERLSRERKARWAALRK